MNCSGGSRRVTRRASHARSAPANTPPALYQCRLLAFTLPTTTLLCSTTLVATSAAGSPTVRPPLPTPVRHTTPPGATFWIESVIELPDSRAFDDHVGLEADARDGARVVSRPQVAHEVRFWPRFEPVEHVDLEPALPADESRKQANRPGAGHEHGPRLPEGAVPHGANLLPGLRDDGRGLEQHAQEAKGAVDLHRVLGLDPPALGHEAVDLLDAAFCVLTVPAHVPFAHRAVGARHGVGAPDDAGQEFPLVKRTARPGVHHAAQGFVPEHQALLAFRGPAVLAFHDFDVRAADADGHRFHENRPVARVGLRNVLQA